ncbi:MAG: hypothetical protein CVU84_05355 [Firmicutes bacterium HGW-Firmicutes-1]|jgi:hypothetical protein|nr:MAG: hypothetical protein CVU84_05355 [Firmicutes bacterium HGW-Firmicutes-1]
MLGIQDLNIFLVFSLCVISALFCVVYGVLNWNKGQEKEMDEIKEELLWEEKDNKINDLL